MDIKRTGPPKPHIENAVQGAERVEARSKSPAAQPTDRDAVTPLIGIPQGVSRADLGDARKAEEALKQCADEFVADAGRRLGWTLTEEQRVNLVEFLGNDPVMRGKLQKYLEQVVK